MVKQIQICNFIMLVLQNLHTRYFFAQAIEHNFLKVTEETYIIKALDYILCTRETIVNKQ